MTLILASENHSTRSIAYIYLWQNLRQNNIEDAKRGLKKKIITLEEYKKIKRAIDMGQLPPQSTPLGGKIGIHGGHAPNKTDTWTDGCIALFNRDIEELYEYVSVGTPIMIKD